MGGVKEKSELQFQLGVRKLTKRATRAVTSVPKVKANIHRIAMSDAIQKKEVLGHSRSLTRNQKIRGSLIAGAWKQEFSSQGKFTED